MYYDTGRTHSGAKTGIGMEDYHVKSAQDIEDDRDISFVLPKVVTCLRPPRQERSWPAFTVHGALVAHTAVTSAACSHVDRQKRGSALANGELTAWSSLTLLEETCSFRVTSTSRARS